jgi:Dyp-type peroxidase family
MGDIDLDDIQGIIVRGYRKPVARHLLLRIDRAEAFKAMLGNLAVEDHASGPFVTAAADWLPKPPAGVVPTHCVNIGFTFAGLEALGLPDASLDSFPEEFKQGAVRRAAEVGDTGPSAPEHWVPSLVSRDAHVLLSIFADSDAELESVSAELRGRAAAGGGATEFDHFDGRFLPGEVAHFGYRDGISQPTIAGVPMAGLPDPLAPAPAGEFLLGYPSQHDGFVFPVPQPAPLGRNGSFGAFRILCQDVHGFETFLERESARAGIDKELLAAKVCGRWRNGVPIMMSPDTASPDPPIPAEKLNFFDYVDAEGRPELGDPLGRRCPIGSHIRRANPRSSRVAGSGLSHRIVRRGLPYGPPYDPEHPDDGHERGLVGMFIGVDLKDQFEFVMSEWLNDGTFAPGLGSTKDPLTGANDPADSRFAIPGGTALSGFSRFVTTRGGAYCFLPSMTALRHLAADGASQPTQ